MRSAARWWWRAARACACTTRTTRTTSRAWPGCGARRWGSASPGWWRRPGGRCRCLPYEHVYSHQTHGPAVELAERLLALAPAAITKVFFACSGSEANDTIVRMIWYYNNALGRKAKKKIVSRNRAFHGSTCVSGSLTGLTGLQADFDLPLPGFVHTRRPHHYREGRAGRERGGFCDAAGRGAGGVDSSGGRRSSARPSLPSR